MDNDGGNWEINEPEYKNDSYELHIKKDHLKISHANDCDRFITVRIHELQDIFDLIDHIGEKIYVKK